MDSGLLLQSATTPLPHLCPTTSHMHQTYGLTHSPKTLPKWCVLKRLDSRTSQTESSEVILDDCRAPFFLMPLFLYAGNGVRPVRRLSDAWQRRSWQTIWMRKITCDPHYLLCDPTLTYSKCRSCRRQQLITGTYDKDLDRMNGLIKLYTSWNVFKHT